MRIGRTKTMTDKYGLTTGVRAIDGWIDVDGAFFACAAWQHEYAAGVIAYAAYGLEYGSSRDLIDRGWARCSSPYLMFKDRVREVQLATAREVSAIMQNEYVKRNFIKNIEKYEAGLY